MAEELIGPDAPRGRINLRVPPEIHQRLVSVADALGCDLTALLNLFIVEALPKYMQKAAAMMRANALAQESFAKAAAARGAEEMDLPDLSVLKDQGDPQKLLVKTLYAAKDVKDRGLIAKVTGIPAEQVREWTKEYDSQQEAFGQLLSRILGDDLMTAMRKVEEAHDRAEAIRAARAGWPVSTVAQFVNVPEAALREWLAEAGIRPTEGRSPIQSGMVAESPRSLAQTLFVRGEKPEDIAAALGLDPAKVMKWVAEIETEREQIRQLPAYLSDLQRLELLHARIREIQSARGAGVTQEESPASHSPVPHSPQDHRAAKGGKKRKAPDVSPTPKE